MYNTFVAYIYVQLVLYLSNIAMKFTLNKHYFVCVLPLNPHMAICVLLAQHYLRHGYTIIKCV